MPAMLLRCLRNSIAPMGRSYSRRGISCNGKEIRSSCRAPDPAACEAEQARLYAGTYPATGSPSSFDVRYSSMPRRLIRPSCCSSQCAWSSSVSFSWASNISRLT